MRRININQFCKYLIEVGCQEVVVHNFKCVHKLGKIFPKEKEYQTKNNWMGFFDAYLIMLRATKTHFIRSDLFVGVN